MPSSGQSYPFNPDPEKLSKLFSIYDVNRNILIMEITQPFLCKAKEHSHLEAAAVPLADVYKHLKILSPQYIKDYFLSFSFP